MLSHRVARGINSRDRNLENGRPDRSLPKRNLATSSRDADRDRCHQFVGLRIDALEIKDQSIVDAIDKLSDHPVKVKGVSHGDTIEVESVAPAK